MPGPIVFISRNRVKEGKLDAFRQLYQEGAMSIEADKPGTVAYLAYASDDGSEVCLIHIFSDAEAMTRHMQGAGDRAKKAYEFIEPDTLEIFGDPGDDTLMIMKQAAGQGAHLRVFSDSLGGYLHLRSG